MLAFALLGAPSTARAADPPASVGRDNELVTIERPIRDVAVASGSSSVEDVLIKNQTARAVRIDVASRDLATRRDGAATLAIEGVGTQPRGAGAWLGITARSLRIEPFDQAVVKVRVKVPEGTAAGAWAGAVLLTVSGVGAASTVTLQQETSISFLFTVRGDVERDVRIAVEPSERLRWRGGESKWKVTIANEGTAFESYGGRLRIDAGIGGMRSYRLDNGILFPGERRTQIIDANVRPAPDRVTGRLDITTRGRDGTGDPATDLDLTARAGVLYVVPWWLPFVLAAAVLVIGLRLRARRHVDDAAAGQYET